MAIFPAGDLSAYLRQASNRPFDWRTNNCAHFVGGWIAHYRGIDRTVLDIMAQRSGMMRLCDLESFDQMVDNAARVLSLVRRAGPTQQGDVVMISKLAGNPWRALGLADPPFVVVLAYHGVLFTRAEPIAVWALE
jgi:Domain of unknown function (DUF6950)